MSMYSVENQTPTIDLRLLIIMRIIFACRETSISSDVSLTCGDCLNKKEILYLRHIENKYYMRYIKRIQRISIILE